MSHYFPKPFRNFGGVTNVKVDLSNYATKTDLKNVTHVDTSSFASFNFVNLKTEVDKLDLDKLAPFPVDLSKFCDLVKNDVAKKTVFDKLVEKVDNIDTSGFALKTKYQTDKTELENKFSDKLNKLNNHNHDKYIDTSEFNKLTADVFNARLSQANLITKADFDAKLSILNRKITENKTKHLLVENELKKLKTFDSSYYIDESYFEEDGTPNFLIFQPLNKYFKADSSTDAV